MFFLCVNIIKIKNTNKIFERWTVDIISGFAFCAVSLINVVTKIVKDENIEDIEGYLKIKNKIIQVKINKMLSA